MLTPVMIIYYQQSQLESPHNKSKSLPCGWLTNVVTQKLGILAMSSDRFWKNGWRNLLYFCSTFKISSLACSFSLGRKKQKHVNTKTSPSSHLPLLRFKLTCQFHSVLHQCVQLLPVALFLQRERKVFQHRIGIQRYITLQKTNYMASLKFLHNQGYWELRDMVNLTYIHIHTYTHSHIDRRTYKQRTETC